MTDKKTLLEGIVALDTLLRDFEASALDANASEEDLAAIREMRRLCAEQKALLSRDNDSVQ